MTRWYDKNESRAYPLVDAAQGERGKNLPEGFLCDCSLVIPAELDGTIYISGAAVSSYLVSVVLSAYVDSTEYLLGMLTVSKPVEIHKNYSIDPLTPGVAGWLVFGEEVSGESTFVYRADEPGQSQVLSRCIHVLPASQVTSIGKLLGVDELVGDVALTSDGSLEIISAADAEADADYLANPEATRLVNGSRRKAIVVRIPATAGDYAALMEYTGPCGGRLTGSTCPDAAITSINEVTPDSNGNITLTITGGLGVNSITDDGTNASGIALSYPLGLSDVCDRSPVRKFSPTTDICGGD